MLHKRTDKIIALIILLIIWLAACSATFREQAMQTTPAVIVSTPVPSSTLTITQVAPTATPQSTVTRTSTSSPTASQTATPTSTFTPEPTHTPTPAHAIISAENVQQLGMLHSWEEFIPGFQNASVQVAWRPDSSGYAYSNGEQVFLYRVLETEPERIIDERSVALAFSSENPDWLLMSYYGKTTIINTKTGRVIRTIENYNECPGNLWAKFSPSGRYLVTINETGNWREDNIVQTAYLWDLSTDQCAEVLVDPLGGFFEIVFSPDERFLALSFSGSLHIFDLQTQRERCMLDGIRVGFCPSQNTFAVSVLNRVSLWSIDDCGHIQSFDTSNFSNTVAKSLEFSSDGNLLFAGYSTGAMDVKHYLGVWDVETGEKLTDFNIPTGPIDTLSISPDGRYLLVGTRGSHMAPADVMLWAVLP